MTYKNRLFNLAPYYDKKSELKYYGVIDQVNYYENEGRKGYYITIDCIDAKQVQKLIFKQDNKLIDVINKINGDLLQIDISIDYYKEYLSASRKKNLEGLWLKVSKIKGLSYDFYSVLSLTNYFYTVGRGSYYQFEVFDQSERKNLKKLKRSVNLEFACSEYIDENKALSIIDSVNKVNPENINVVAYSVGQGNAVCINQKNKEGKAMPLFYFDIGGGANFNAPTFIERDFKISNDTFFILSHWDEDHYETARRTPALIKDKTYIGPTQIVAPRNLIFIKSIIATGKLILLPTTFTAHTFSLGQLVRCTRVDLTKKNDTGLALILELGKSVDLTKILLPGDAQYFYIPIPKETRFDSLLATHHGGELKHPYAVPLALKKHGCVAYSWGKNNIYVHPLDDSVNRHENKHWGKNPGGDITRLDTPYGDVMFSIIPYNKPSCLADTEKSIKPATFTNRQKLIAFKIEEILGPE